MDYEIGAGELVSTAVVRAVSAVQGQQPLSLQPLNDVIDPDALDALLEPDDGGLPRSGGCLTFVYSDCKVRIDNGESLAVRPLDARVHADRSPTTR